MANTIQNNLILFKTNMGYKLLVCSVLILTPSILNSNNSQTKTFPNKSKIITTDISTDIIFEPTKGEFEIIEHQLHSLSVKLEALKLTNYE